MKKFTLKDCIAVLYVLVIITILLNTVGCASTQPQCQGLSGPKLQDCYEAAEAKKAHEQMVRSGFYEGGGANR